MKPPRRRNEALIFAVPAVMLLSLGGMLIAESSGGRARRSSDPLPLPQPVSAPARPDPLLHSGPLLAAQPDWGTPPAKDWPKIKPPLLGFKGWCRYVGAGGILGAPELTRQYVCTNYTLVVDAGYSSEFSLIDAASGEERWGQHLDYDCSARLHPDSGLLLRTAGVEGGGLTAYSAADGQQRWQYSGGYPAVFAGDVIWTRQDLASPQFGLSLVTPTARFARLDSRTGRELDSLDGLKLTGIAAGDSGPGGQFVFKSDGEFQIASANGSLRSVPSDRPDWEADILVFPGGFVVAEGTQMEYGPDPASYHVVNGVISDSDPYNRQHGQDPWPSVTSLLSCYELPSGKRRWQQEIGDNYEHKIFVAPGLLSRFGDYCLLYDYTIGIKPQLFDLRSGKLVWESADEDMSAAHAFCVDGERLYQLEQAAPEQGATLKVSSLKGGSVRTAKLPGFPPVFWMSAAGERLLLTPPDGGWNDAFAENSFIYCLELDENGLPLKGRMSAQGFPDDMTELQAQFFASRAPLEDAALMRSIISGGMNAMLRLLEDCPPQKYNHLDALAAATQYLYSRQGSDRYNVSAVNAFIQTIRERAGPEYSPSILRWQQDSSLSALQPQLAGLLAECGGREAEQQLAGSGPQTGVKHLADSAQPAGADPDSDADGLSDAQEARLFTDPQNPDSDADGIKDGEDGAPLSNPAWMGPVERGVARALEFCRQSTDQDSSSRVFWEASSSAPLQARYLVFYGSAPVDYAPNPAIYSIAMPVLKYDINSPPSTDPGSDPRDVRMEVARVTWWETGRTVEERYAEYLKQTGLTGNEHDTPTDFGWSSGEHWNGSKLNDPPYDYPPGAKAALFVDFAVVGYVVEMTKRGGEWYPLKISMSWIS